MNWEAWKPLATLAFTTTLKFVGGLLVAHGLATEGPGLEALGGAATTAAGALWSWWVQKGHLAAGDWLKHLTDTATQAAAIEVAKKMAPASLTGAAQDAKAAVALAAVAKVLLVAFALSLFLAANPAMAQTGNIVKDIAAARAARGLATPKATVSPASPVASATSDPLSKLMSDLAKIQSDVVTGVVADINAADADAGTIITPAVAATATTAAVPAVVKDPIAHACYPAEVQFLQSLPVATAPTGNYVLVQLFQKKRDFIMQIQAGLPAYLRLGCAALLGDEIQTFTKSMALIGVSVAANGLLPGSGGLVLPALPTL